MHKADVKYCINSSKEVLLPVLHYSQCILSMACARYLLLVQQDCIEALTKDLDSTVPAIKWIQVKDYFFPTESDEGIQSKRLTHRRKNRCRNLSEPKHIFFKM